MATRHSLGAILYRASCDDCSWRLDARNGHAMAALHHDRSGHTVNVVPHGSLTYCGPVEAARRERWARVELPRWLGRAG